MSRWLQRLPEPPTFEGDAGRTRTARLLNVLLVFYLVAVPIAGAVYPQPTGIIVAVAYLVLVATVWLLMRRGFVGSAAWTVVVGNFVLCTAALLVSGGARSPAAAAVTGCVVLAGILLGWRVAVATGAATTLLMLGLGIAERAGFPIAAPTASALVYSVVFLACVGLITGLLAFALWLNEDARRSLSEHAVELESGKAALEKANRAYRILSDCNQNLIRARSETELLKPVCDIIVRDGACSLAWIALADKTDRGGLHLAADAGPAAGYLEAVDPNAVGQHPEDLAMERAWRSGETVVVNDVGVEAADADWAAAASEHGIRSAAVFVLKSGGQKLGLLGIYSPEAEWFDAEEVDLLDELANDIVYGLETLRDRAAAESAEMLIAQSEERRRQAARAAGTGVFDHDHARGTAWFSPELLAVFGWDEDDAYKGFEDWLDATFPDDREAFARGFAAAADPRGEGVSDLDYRIVRPDGAVRWISVKTQTFFEGEGEGRHPVRTVGAMQDISDRKAAETQIRLQLRRLDALHSIDTAISGSLNLKLTLGVIVDEVLSALDADAVTVLMLDPHTYALEYAYGRGFHTRGMEDVRLRLGEGSAGQAALDQQTIVVPDLSESDSCPVRKALFAEEGLRSHAVTPLVVKGQTKGVLEVFHRQPFEPDREWSSFFEALALQTAIALDSGTMFDSLERSNVELSQAYDATIEGWSRALDLRDRETEGHTQRVTEMAVKLAQAMGIGAAEIAHIRRGALLHDIGKMGVPDEILLKAGPLSEEEWAIMRQHPQLAYEMLAPIAYLRPALDVPSCHHEWWDGTGYPRGLKGVMIPLAARIFAVVDVWDALGSDRPYRKAWPKEKVATHIREESGTHFDPEVVDRFMSLLDEQQHRS